jgi:MSHA pilin protein MshD
MHPEAGATLVELVLSIVVIGIAVAGVLLVMGRTVTHSADPLLDHQAVAIAEAYLEEILANPIADPTDPETGSSEAGETRAEFDDVRDYAALPDQIVRDQMGNPLAALSGYRVEVGVQDTALGPPGAGQIPAPSGQAVRVTVTVRHSTGSQTQLTGFRAGF